MQRNCPHCGAPLPEDAVFCPHCAQDVHPRKTPKPPIPLRNKLLLGLLALVIVAAAGAGIYWFNRPYVPQTYDGVGEVFYSVDNREYQLAVAWPDNRTEPAPDIYMSGRAEDVTRWPSRLYVNDAASGADAWTEFEPLVEQVTVEVDQDEAGSSDLEPGTPEHMDYSPDAAMVCTLDFTGDCGEPQIIWNIQMKNGDIIRVRQTIHVELVVSYTYDWHDYPMNTIEELTTLLGQIQEETQYSDEVIINLPPVTYEEPLELTGRSYEFHGCTDGSGRTVFTDTVQVNTKDAYWLNFFYDIDFVGDGTGVALSFPISGRADHCTFTNWGTAVMGYGSAWVNVIDCYFENNTTAFHFNSTGQSANHSRYDNNTFIHNGTAVLLENVPTDMTIYFEGSKFIDNDVDIDNRCNHSVDTNGVTFQ